MPNYTHFRIVKIPGGKYQLQVRTKGKWMVPVKLSGDVNLFSTIPEAAGWWLGRHSFYDGPLYQPVFTTPVVYEYVNDENISRNTLLILVAACIITAISIYLIYRLLSV